MSDHVIALIALVLVFTVATFTSVHMGALAIGAAFITGTLFFDQSADDIFGGFPGDLFVVLVGVTFLFAIAKNNGTVDWLVHASTRAVRGRIALIPWVMFLITAALTAVGAVVPAAVAIVAPIGMGFAARYRIHPVLLGLFIINGASAGGFSPIGIFGSITNGVVERNGLAGNPALLFAASFAFNVVLSGVVFLLFGGRRLIGRRAQDPTPAPGTTGTRAATHDGPHGPHDGPRDGPRTGGGCAAGGSAGAAAAAEPGTLTLTRPGPEPGAGPGTDPAADQRLDTARLLTLLGLLSLVVGALFFDLNVGLLAMTVTVVLSLVSPASSKGAVDRCAWSTVLLVCGIVTFVGMMERIGTIDYLGKEVAGIGAPLLGALLICLIGSVVSAFASTTGILGALIPIAVPFLLSGEIGAVGLITALAISSSVVDSSPISTSGALVTASAPAEQRDAVFRRLMQWGLCMAAVAPPVTWLLFVLPGWL
ncbi:SLC13 family permease [Streptomyces subrutilus]|uniref:SLC13 family permease n=1 Tax=Streptomyces subrutilus TaxID=36818 RepID=UPI003420190A